VSLLGNQMNARHILDMLQEIRVGTTLPRHPNVAAFIGACIHHDFPWVVFEYIDGPNLLQLYTENQKRSKSKSGSWRPKRNTALQVGNMASATHCNALQRTATQCNTLRRTATHCSTLLQTAKHCNTLQCTAMHCNALSTLQRTATH